MNILHVQICDPQTDHDTPEMIFTLRRYKQKPDNHKKKVIKKQQPQVHFLICFGEIMCWGCSFKILQVTKIVTLNV